MGKARGCASGALSGWRAAAGRRQEERWPRRDGLTRQPPQLLLDLSARERAILDEFEVGRHPDAA